jgi:endonuclease/exonuclease/phosphatase family metal-dependent hydrolase
MSDHDTGNGQRFRFATWNVGGCQTGASHQRNHAADLDYFANMLAHFAPDIVCIQESHSYYDGRTAQHIELAQRTGLTILAAQPISPSHMDDSAQLTLSILGRNVVPAGPVRYIQFPNPRLSAKGPTGEEWTLFDKGVLSLAIETPVVSGTINVMNAHCFPLHYFGARADEPQFRPIWDVLEAEILRCCSAPLLAAIDTNFEPIGAVLGDALAKCSLASVIEGTPTTPKGAQQDFIVVSPGFRSREAKAVPTEADHHFCYVDVTAGW